MEKIIVIGSNSFSGSHFVDLLLNTKLYDVIGISRSCEKPPLFLPYKKRESSHFRFVQIDLNKDLKKLRELIDDFKPNYCVNFAAQSEVAPSWEHPDHWFQTNAVALTNLANLLKDKPFLKKYVHISSPEVYGSCSGFITESAPLNPSTPYAASKAAGDLSLLTFYKNFYFPLTFIRATNVYGPCQQLFKIIPRTIIAITQNKQIHLHGGGSAIKSYIHIGDVSHAEHLIMQKGKIGEIYHVSPDRGVSIKEIVEMICDYMGVSFDKAVIQAPERLGQDKAYTIDSSKIREEFGWHPDVPLKEGLLQTINWVEDNLNAIVKQPLEYMHKE